MTWQPWQERVFAEHVDLSTKLTKLGEFLRTEAFKELDCAERDRLLRQEGAMGEYYAVLSERIMAFRRSVPE